LIVPLVTLFLVLMLLCAVAALQVSDLLAAVTIFGGFSFFSAIFFTLLGALDVAFTEAAVGAAITTVFFVTAIYRTDRKVD
jgi:energy-converting hydrogenase B subunit D